MEAFFSVFAMLAVGCFIVAWHLHEQRRTWRSRAVFTEGVISEVYRHFSLDDQFREHPWYFPTVKFSTNGKIFSKVAQQGYHEHLEVGEWVVVRFDPANPTQAALGKYGQPGINPVYFYVLAAVFTLVSGLFMI